MSTAPPTSSLTLLLARVFWIMLGPAVLFLLAIAVVQNPGGWFTVPDLAFLTVLSLTLLARQLEFRGGHPRTATGEPATAADLKRYSRFALSLGLGTWVLANLVSNYLVAN